MGCNGRKTTITTTTTGGTRKQGSGEKCIMRSLTLTLLTWNIE